jgi:tetratricopeptide (TPR) repeat protein
MTAAEDPRIASFRAMVGEDDSNELAWFSLGQALYDARRHAEADQAFARAAALQPDLMMAWFRRAQCLVALGQYAQARPYAEETRRLAIAQNHAGPRGDADDLLEEIDDALDA